MNFERCKVCNVPLTENDKSFWCKVKQCPNTEQRHPNEKQIKQFKIGAKDA